MFCWREEQNTAQSVWRTIRVPVCMFHLRNYQKYGVWRTFTETWGKTPYDFMQNNKLSNNKWTRRSQKTQFPKFHIQIRRTTFDWNLWILWTVACNRYMLEMPRWSHILRSHGTSLKNIRKVYAGVRNTIVSSQSWWWCISFKRNSFRKMNTA